MWFGSLTSSDDHELAERQLDIIKVLNTLFCSICLRKRQNSIFFGKYFDATQLDMHLNLFVFQLKVRLLKQLDGLCWKLIIFWLPDGVFTSFSLAKLAVECKISGFISCLFNYVANNLLSLVSTCLSSAKFAV